MSDRYVETESGVSDSYNQKKMGRLERLSVFPAGDDARRGIVACTSISVNDRITYINHNIISLEGRMTSIGSAIRNASSRYGTAVIMLLLATLLGVMAPPSLRAQVTLTPSVASPQCFNAAYNLNASVTHRLNPVYNNPGAPGYAPYAQGAGTAGNGAVNNVLLGDDEVSGEQNPVLVGGGNFNFNFWGQAINLSADGIYIGSNGFITFNNNNAATGIIPQNIPNAAAPNNAIYICNTDLNPNNVAGSIWWQVQDDGAGVGQRLVITFNNVPFVNPFQANLANMQLVIWAQDGQGLESVVDWHLNVPNVAGFTGTIGAETDCGTAANAILNNGALAGLAGISYRRAPGNAGNAEIAVEWFDGATSIGTAAYTTPAGAGPTTVSLAYASMAASGKAAGAHSYTATVTYRYNGCNTYTENVTSAALPYTVVALPVAQTVSETGSNECGTSASVFSVPNSNNPNTFAWTAAPAGAVSVFTPNGTNAAQSTSVTWNNSNLSASGTSVTLTVVESTSIPTVCAGPNNTITRTIYRTPAASTGITGSGVGTVAGAPGNPCAGLGGVTVFYTANYAAGDVGLGTTTNQRWTITGAPAGTQIGDGGTWATVDGTGTATFTHTFSPATIQVRWPNSTTNQSATLTVQASNGTGGATGIGGANKSCAGPVSAGYTIRVNGVPAAETVTVNSAATICDNDVRVYSMTLRAGSSYTWSVTGGVAGVDYSLVTGAAPNNNTATITWLTPGTYTVNCTELTAGNCTTVHTGIGATVRVVPAPSFTAGAVNACTYIGGDATSGSSLNEYTYTVSGTAGNSFAFTVINGIFTATNTDNYTINPGAASNSATVRWSAAGANSVSVTETNSFGCSQTVTRNVTVTASASPKTLSGPGVAPNPALNPCVTTGGHVYTIASHVAANSYNWSITGGTFTATAGGGVIGGGGSIITGSTGAGPLDATVTWTSTTASISTNETTPAGCITSRTYAISVNTLPNGTVSTTTPEICNGGSGTVTYTAGTGDIAGATYSWALSAGLTLVGSSTNASVQFTGNTVGAQTATVTVTNPGVGGCTLVRIQNITVVANPTGAAPTVPATICVGGAPTLTLASGGAPAPAVARKWELTLTPVGAYSGNATLTTTINQAAGTGTATVNWAPTIGDSSVADVLAGGSFNLTVKITDTQGTASCSVTNTYGAFTVVARPARPVANVPSVVCVTDASTYTVSNYTGAGLTVTGTGLITVAVAAPNFTITSWGAAGAKTLTVTHADLVTGCTRASEYAVTVAASPANPQPAPVKLGGAAVGAECVDSTYYGSTPAAGLLSPQPTTVVTYQVPTASVLANHYYQWYVTNGVIVTGGAGTYTVVPAVTNTTATLNATTVQVMWTGPTPGKVKYLVFTSDPASTPPTPCFATSVEPNVPLPIIPTTPLSFTTSDAAGTNTVCEGQTATLTLSGSTVGLTYAVEKWNGSAWVATTAPTTAGTGAAVSITVPASELVYTVNPNPYTANTFRVVARDASFASCAWLRTATDVETIYVYDQPNNVPVAVTTPIVCDANGVTLTIGSAGSPSQSYARYTVQRRQIVPTVGVFANVATLVNVSGNNGVLTVTDNTTSGIGSINSQLNTDNYEYQVIADIDPAFVAPGPLPVPTCVTTMTTQPTARIFEEPVNPTVSFTPNPVCWFDDITVNLASTQAGVTYEVKVAGVSLATPLVIAGNGSPMSATFNSNRILGSNPSVSATVNNVQVEAKYVSNVTYPRPIPASGCPVTYGSTTITVNEKPNAVINGTSVACGSGNDYFWANTVSPAPSSYSWAITSSAPVGTAPLTSSNQWIDITWGAFLVPCTPTAPVSSTQTIRLIAQNGGGCLDTAIQTVTLYPSPTDAVIQGDATACIYGGFEEHLETYTLARSTGAGCTYPAGTTYAWSMPTGTVAGSIRSGQGTTSIVGEWNATGGSGTGTVSCLVTLPASWGGCSYTATYNVQVYTLPAPAISGSANVCQNQQNVVYAASNFPTDTYTWQVMGGTIDGGSGAGVVGDTATRSGVGLWNVSVDWNNTPSTNAFVRLTEISAVGCKNVTTFNVTVHPTPTPVVNGPTVVCKNSVNTWSTANNAPANSYVWNVVGATILSGSNSASASIQSGAAAFTVSVTETVVATGCSKTSTTVNVSVLDAPNPTITRDGTGAIGGACLNQTVTYGNNDPIAASPSYNYQWTVTNGTVTGGTTGTTVTVTWGTVGTGSVSLTKWHNGSQCSTTVSQSVAITNNPAPAISGPATVCGGAEHTYSTTNVVGNTYSWSGGSNGTITGGGSTSAATIRFTNPAVGSSLSTNITVTETNTLSGCATVVTIPVTINYAPQVTSITRVSTGGVVGQACEGSTIDYSVSNNTGSSYVWTVTGGNFVGTSNTSTVSVLWTTIGNQTLTVTETNAAGNCSATSTQNVAVEYLPTPVITGAATVCTDQTYTYSTPAVAGSSYVWSLPLGGGNILSSVTGSSINVQWINSGARQVQVVESNGNCSATTTASITVGKTPTTTAIARINPVGNVAQACNGATITYSTSNNGSSTYQWTVTGGSFVGSSTGNSVDVKWTTLGNQTLTVVETTTGSSCTKTATQTVSVEDTPAPSISGATTVCTGNSVTYSTPAVAGHTYNWSISGGGTVTSATNSNLMTVQWTDAGSHTVTLTQTNATGNCATTVTASVTVRLTPTQSAINGLSAVCVGSTTNYNVDFATFQAYVWTVTGGSIINGAGTSSIDVDWSTIGTQTVSVVITTSNTNCSTTLTKNVAVEFQPAPSITGAAVVCESDVETYSTASNAGSTYAWSVTGGTIVSGSNSNAIAVVWQTQGNRTVTVTETNATSNCDSTVTLPVTVNDLPGTTTITLNSAGNLNQACEGYTYAYGTDTPGASAYSYNWSVTGGQFAGSNTGSTVNVRWTVVGTQTLTVTVSTPNTNCSVTVSEDVAVTPTPQPLISGARVACTNKDQVYSTPAVTGNTYNWSITPANAFSVITGYPNSNAIQVKWIQPGLHTVTLTERNIAGGCETTVSTTVQVNNVPTPFISSATGYGNPVGRRPGIVCNESTHTYTTTATPGNTFVWTVTNGQIINGQNTNTIQVKWGGSGIGTIAVQETVPGSDCITTLLDSIVVRPTPTPAITGQLNPCASSVQTYNTPLVSGNSYNWAVVGGTIQTGQGTNEITVLWANTNWPNTVNGSVTVTEWVTDALPAQSCIRTASVNTTVRPNTPTPTISGNFAVCATDLNTTPPTNNTVTYTTIAPAQNAGLQGTITYAWSVSANGTITSANNGTSVSVQWFNNTAAQTTGTITLAFTSSFGCTSTYTESVTINPLPTPSIVGPASVCLNDVSQYRTAGVVGNTYTWSVTGGNTIVNGQGTPNVQIKWNAPGSYTLSVSERNSLGCTVINTRTITVNQLPSITITHSGNTTFCQGGSVTLFAPEGTGYSYAWSTGETSRAIVVHTGGDYFVTVTDANGCSARSNTITVNVFPASLPIITVGGPTTFCEGENVTLTAPAGFSAYLWERTVDAGDTWTSVGSSQTLVVTTTGGYRVTIADNNGCTGKSTVVDVFVNAKPTPSLTVIGSTSVCSGDSVEVRAPQGYVSYEWVGTSGAIYPATRSIIVTETETVFVRVVDANGCEGQSDPVTITVAPVVPATIAVSGPTTFCEGESVTFAVENAGEFATYYWNGAGTTSPSLTVNESGTYYVTATTAAGCVYNSDPIQVVVNALPARPVITRSGDVLTANSADAASFQWFKSNVNGSSISTDPTYTVNEPGTYFVRITDKNGCSSVSDGFDVILTSVDEDVVAGVALVVFPNPTNGQFTIKGDVSVTGNVKIELVNMFGETVMTTNEMANGGTFSSSVDMGTLASGVYNVVVTTENNRWSVRLVRQ